MRSLKQLSSEEQAKIIQERSEELAAADKPLEPTFLDDIVEGIATEGTSLGLKKAAAVIFKWGKASR